LNFIGKKLSGLEGMSEENTFALAQCEKKSGYKMSFRGKFQDRKAY
jgi:hypothetical protein